MKKTDPDIDKERRKQILDAALQCFLQYGYTKTSMDNIASKADISRPLIYSKFKNKQELLTGLYVDFMESALSKADKILNSQAAIREKLINITETITVQSWAKVAGKPMTVDFYEQCQKHFPAQTEGFKKRRTKIYQQLFAGNKDLTEIFLLAIHGLVYDSPSVNTLRGRIALMIDQFTSSGQ